MGEPPEVGGNVDFAEWRTGSGAGGTGGVDEDRTEWRGSAPRFIVDYHTK